MDTNELNRAYAESYYKEHFSNPVAMPAPYGYAGQEDPGDSLSRQVVNPAPRIVHIKGFEGLYSVTDDGFVISHGGKTNHKQDILLSESYDKDGYRRVTLQKDKQRSYYRIARLVATAFVPNPANYNIVNHLDENKANDFASNLEWTDNYGNWKHSEESMPNTETAVIKLTLDGEYVCEYKSLMDAARDNNVRQGNITNCLQGRCKSTGGFRWMKK